MADLQNFLKNMKHIILSEAEIKDLIHSGDTDGDNKIGRAQSITQSGRSVK